MLRVHLILQWQTAFLKERLVTPLLALKEEKAIDLEIIAANEYSRAKSAKADVIICTDGIDPGLAACFGEAKRRGVRIVYDVAPPVSPAPGEEDIYQRLILPAFNDLRALALRDRLLRIATQVTVTPEGKTALARHTGIEGELLERPDKRRWLTILQASTPKRIVPASGKRIYFLTPTLMWPHHYIADIMVRTLMEMGHQVRLFTLRPSRFHAETICLPKHFDETFVKQVADYGEDAWRVPLLIEREQPDLILTVQGYTIPRQLLAEIKKRGVPTAAWFMDEPYDAARSASFAPLFSHVFLQDSASVEFHRRHGNPNSFYLPHGCDPGGVHALLPGEQPGDVRQVALIGTPFPKRIAVVRKLRAAGIPVAVAGTGWEGVADGLQISSGVSLTAAAAWYRSSAITINMHRDEDDFSTNPGRFSARSPNCSTFYIAGSGGFQLVDSARCELPDFYRPGEEIATFADPDDCVAKVRHYLSNREERERIRKAGLERSRRDHSYARRLESLLKTIDEHPAIDSDNGYRRLAFIDLGADPGERSGSIPTIRPIKGVHETTPPGIHLVTIPADGGFAHAVNAAILETSADIVVAGNADLLNQALNLKLADRFSNDLRLGMLVLGKPAAGFLMPIRLLLESGAFRYGNGPMAVDDMMYRLRDLGYGVEVLPGAGTSLASSPLSRDEENKDRESFREEWSDEPEARLAAGRLARVARDNFWKISRHDARKITEQVVALAPRYVKELKALGDLALKEGDVPAARAAFATCRECVPDDQSVALLYAGSLYLSRELEEALTVLNAVIDSTAADADKATAWYQKGLILSKGNDPAAARQAFSAVLGLVPNHSNSMKELSLLLLDEGQQDAAIDMMARRATAKESHETLNDLGAVLWQSGRKEEAFDCFKRALDENPVEKNTLGNMVTAGRELGRIKEARQVLDTALACLPDDKDIQKLRASIDMS